MSEKDANIALLEMTSTKQRRNTEEIDKLNREKEKLQQQLKEVVSQAEGVKTSQTLKLDWRRETVNTVKTS